MKKNSNKAMKSYFKMAAGSYCGLFLEKRLALRMQKLLYKQEQEIKELLASNIEETEVHNWSLAYPDNNQTTVYYFNPKDTHKEKMHRVELFTKTHIISKIDEVYFAKNGDEAEYNYLEHHNKLDFYKTEDK